MRELIKKDQLVTIVPQDFKNSNKGKVLDVSMEGFRMELKYKPEGLIKNHIFRSWKIMLFQLLIL